MKRLAILLLVLVVAAAAAFVLRWWGGGPGSVWLGRVMGNPRVLVEPAPLFAAHRAEADCEDCYACHELTAAVSSLKCEVCHEEIAQRVAAGVGYHGRDLAGECVECHTDHTDSIIEFDHSTFNHQRAQYPLAGRHADVECEECHFTPEGFRYLGLSFEQCVDCHDDPHRGELTTGGRDCLVCHDHEGWIGRHVSFIHDRDSDYPLRGAHAAVECENCHEPSGGTLGRAKFRGLGILCQDCHEDPHADQFEGDACEKCHREAGFTGPDLLFRHHDFAPYRLDGAHATVECLACHVTSEVTGAPVWRGLSHDCAACHEDPHEGQFEGDGCATCHSTTGFEGRQVLFDHARFEAFPLTGAHATVACAGCHEPPSGTETILYRGAPRDCAACHDDPHQGSLRKTDCAACHGTGAWRGLDVNFDHDLDTSFPIDAAHGAVDCAGCHESVVFRPTPTTCSACHAEEAGHLEGRVRLGEVVDVWPSSPHAGRVDCVGCHDTGVAHQADESYARMCVGCHTRRYFELFFQRTAHLANLATESAESRARTYLRVGSHNYVEAEKRLRALVEKTRDG